MSVKLELQTIKCYLSEASSLANLTFSQPVGSLFYGISGFLLIFPENNVWTGPSGWTASCKITDVQLQLSLTRVSSGGREAYAPTITARLSSKDSGTPELDPSKSWVYITVVALTGDNTASIGVAGNTGLVAAGTEVSVAVASGASGVPVLGGFNLDYGGEHKVAAISAGGNLSGSTVIPTAAMHDDSDNDATARADDGYLYSLKGSPGFITTQKSQLQHSTSYDYDLGAGPLSACAAVMRGFTVKFGSNDDHNISYVGAGLVPSNRYIEASTKCPLPDDPTVVNGSSIRLPYAEALLGDSGEGSSSPKYQDDSSSSVDMILIGITA